MASIRQGECPRCSNPIRLGYGSRYICDHCNVAFSYRDLIRERNEVREKRDHDVQGSCYDTAYENPGREDSAARLQTEK